MRKMGLLGASLVAVLVLGGTMAGAASAKQVGLFEPISGTQVSMSQELGTRLVLTWEGGQSQCVTTSSGDLEPWLPVLEAPPLKTTIFYTGERRAEGCSSQIAGEELEQSGELLKVRVNSVTRAVLVDAARLHEHRLGDPVGEGYCSYEGPRNTPLASVSGKDWTDWTGTSTFKRVRLESDLSCAPSFEVALSVDAYAYGEEEPLITKR